jgi:hypothetical protein
MSGDDGNGNGNVTEGKASIQQKVTNGTGLR